MVDATNNFLLLATRTFQYYHVLRLINDATNAFFLATRTFQYAL